MHMYAFILTGWVWGDAFFQTREQKCCLIDCWKHFVQRSAKIAWVPRNIGYRLWIFFYSTPHISKFVSSISAAVIYTGECKQNVPKRSPWSDASYQSR